MKRLGNILAALGMLVSLAATALPAHAADTNLIANPSVANADPSGQPTNWTPNSWGTNDAALTYLTNNGHSDNTSLGITMNSYTSGDASWIPDASTVTAGENYTYSDWYESNAPTELDAQYTDASGNVSYVYLTTLAPSSAWNQSTVSFTIPANVTEVSVVHILYSVGSLQTDDFSLAQTVSVPPGGGNLIANPSFETANGSTPANWNEGSWGTNDAQFSYTTDAHTGSKSANVSMTSYTDGDAKWYADPVSVTPGQNYTYSDWYKSTAVTQVVAAYLDANGNYTYANLPNAAASTSWQQYSASFTAPASTSKVTIFHLLSSVGSLTIDDVSLTTPQDAALIPNGSVESSTNGKTPTGWQTDSWGTNTVNFSYVNGGHTGSKSVKTTITSYTSGDAKWYFNPITGLQAGQTYNFSVWLKTNTQPEAVVGYDMPDGSQQYDTLPTPLVTSAAAKSWYHYQTTFTVPSGIKDATIYMLINHVGWVQTDDYSLTPQPPVGFQEPLVSLDFDDGWKSTYSNGLPLLKKYGFTSTQFIISGFIGKSGYMTAAQIKAFRAEGSEIGAHTVTHPDLTTLSQSQLTYQLSQSQATLRKLFGNSVAADFASPEGMYNANVITNIKKYYQSHRSVDAGFNSKDTFDPYDIRVQNIDQTTTPAQVAAWVAEAKATNTWLVLVYHQVENKVAPGDTYAVSTAHLNTELSQLKQSGVKVTTMSAALQEVESQL